MADRNIAQLQAVFAVRVAKWLNHCRFEGIEPFIVETLRPFERQAALYAIGRTLPGKKVTNARPGYSYHAFGLALDAVPKILSVDPKKHGGPDWKFDPDGPRWSRVVALAKGEGILWGGTWTSFPDFPHFQLEPAPTLADCRRVWPKGFHPLELDAGMLPPATKRKP